MFDEKYFLKTFEDLINIDSTTGFYENIQKHICAVLTDMGVKYHELHNLAP